MLSFLNRILAHDGLRCGAVIYPGRKPHHRWFRTNQELEKWLIKKRGEGDAYHCNATFPAAGSRRCDPGCLYRAVWVDIDLDFDSALSDLRAAVERGLPPPNIIVSSGGGLHAYWVFTRELSLDEWSRLSMATSSECRRCQLNIDNKCTVDAVRILRPPGTLNHKYDPKPEVEWVETGVEDYAPESFLPGAAADVHHRARDRVPSDSSTAIIPIEGPPASPYSIASQCANVGYFKDTGCAQEGEEPLWKACVGVLAYADNGDAVVHEWSAKDPRYNGAETNDKIAERRKLSGASLCRQFENETDMASLARCRSCPHRGQINSPISLGYRKNERTDIHFGSDSGGDVHNLSVGSVLPRKMMPPGFKTGSGVYMESWGPQKQDMELTAFPLYFVKRTSTSDGVCDTWEWVAEHETKIISVNCGARSYVGELKRQGVIISHEEPFKSYVVECQRMFAKARKEDMDYDCFGWKENDTAFLWGHQLYKLGGETAVTIVDKSLDARARHLRAGGALGRGSLEGWKKNIRGLLQPGFEIQQLALLASVGAIFIHFLEPNEGGAILHLVSPQSGTGKTTALKIAASVWGDIEGLSSTVDDTATSKSIKWGYLRHLPLIFDELVERDPTAAERLVRTFTVGTDKSRALNDGSGLQANNREWSTILISAGNRSIIDTVNSESRSAMSERVVEFTKEFPDGISSQQKQSGREYANAVVENCGWAGEVVLQSIFEDQYSVTAIRGALGCAEGDLWAKYQGWKQSRRYWVRALASMHVAGTLMNALGLISFDVERVIGWACNELYGRDNQELADKLPPEGALSSYLDKNIHVTLVMAGPWHRGIKKGMGVNSVVEGHKLPAREVFVRREIDRNTIYINKDHFKKWLTENNQLASTIIDELFNKKIITAKDVKVTLSAGTHLDSGQQMCLRVAGEELARAQG